MNSKNAKRIILILIVLLVLILAFLFFFRKKTPETNLPNTGTNFPFGESTTTGTLPSGNGNYGSTTTGDVVSGTSTSSQAPLSSEDSKLIAGCSDSSTLEKNDCIKKVAVETKKTSVCAAILGTLGQTDCKNSVNNGEQTPVNVYQNSVTNYTFTFNPVTVSIATSSVGAFSNSLANQFSDVLGKFTDAVKSALDNPDPQYTVEGLYDRIKTLAPLALYAFSEYQAKPGSSLVAQGSGFATTGNTLHIGSYEISGLGSDDGMTMSFTLPQNISVGTYKAWVTNSRGSTQDKAKPIQFVVTNNPLPRPTITSASPEKPTINDTVTLIGTNFTGALAVLTSLGMTTNVRATDVSLSFKVSDLSAVSKVKDISSVKGTIVPVSVVVGTPQGYNKDTFTINIQF